MRHIGPIRRSSIAGTWYPREADALRREVDGHLDRAGQGALGDVRALIGPHAGLRYSGPVAGYAYAAVRGVEFDVVVLVGPSHFVAFDGVSVCARGAFETPLGLAHVETETAGRLLDVGAPMMKEYPRAHESEHCIEMHLPFVQQVLPSTPIVPMVMGDQTPDTIDELARVLAATLTGTSALLVASTDLSHYFDADRAARLDARVVDHINRFDDAGLLTELERYPPSDRGRCVACGGGAAVAVMRAARLLGATQSDVLIRADSAEVSGDRTQVVGYLAAVMRGTHGA